MNGRLRLFALLLIAALASCSSIPRWMGGRRAPSALDAEEVPAAISEAEQALAAQDADLALYRMRAAAQATGLLSETRDHVQVLLEAAAEMRIEQLSQPGADPDGMAELVDVGIPRQLAVTAGVRAARSLHAQGDSYDAFELLKKLDTKFPLHHERVEAADIMCVIGFELRKDDSGFIGMFETVDEAQEVLEYVILNAPWATRCDEAYAMLVDIYERGTEYSHAIERAEQLVLNHPTSRFRAEMQARIPHLRLAALSSPEYDRAALVKARDELQTWLVNYEGHELVPRVRLELGDCLRRLSDSDLIIGKFYERVDSIFGARQHGERAIQEAIEAGDAERERDARAWLASLPPAPDPFAANSGAAP